LITEPTSNYSEKKCPYSSGCPAMKNGGKCPYIHEQHDKVWPRLLEAKPLRVCITGAAGNIGYALIFMIASGHMFGSKQTVIIHLLDIPPMEKVLKGVEMEIVDGAFPLVKGIITTSDPKVAFMNIEVAILIGSFPRQKGMERKDLIQKNSEIFKIQGKALNEFASRNVKVLVVANPANTNCLVTMKCAPDLPKSSFSALTRLDHNRAKAQISSYLKVPLESIRNVVIWGNHSTTQYPDTNFGYINDFPAPKLQTNIRAAVNNDQWLQNDFISIVQQRGGEVIKARNSSSAASAAWAIVNHIHDWLLGTNQGEFISMAVCSDGSYNVPKDLIFSFPVTCRRGEWNIVQNLKISQFSQKKLDITTQELQEERSDAFGLLGIN